MQAPNCNSPVLFKDGFFRHFLPSKYCFRVEFFYHGIHGGEFVVSLMREKGFLRLLHPGRMNFLPIGILASSFAVILPITS